MTLYYTENSLGHEAIAYLQKYNPRGEVCCNFYEITRANTIDENLLLKYFECAVACTEKKNSAYEAMLALPSDLENKIPFWYHRNGAEIIIDPDSGLRGSNISGEQVFIMKFNFFADEKKIGKFDETSHISALNALAREFYEIRHLLIDGNEEPLNVLKEFYTTKGSIAPSAKASKYLEGILKYPE